MENLHDIENYQFPDYSQAEHYKIVSEVRSQYPDKWVIGEIPGFTFNIARKLFRLDNYLVYLMSDLDSVQMLHDRIDAQLENMVRNYAAAGADCIMFPEDWGTQTRTLINPDLWREEFFPRTSRLCSIAHDCGLYVFMHSCGAIGEIIPDLIEAGIDVCQFDQPQLHGLDKLASYQQEKKVTFWCPVDIQKILPTGNEEIIRNEARMMLNKIWKGQGGFIAGFYEDMSSIGVKSEWQEYACQEFIHRGKKDFFGQVFERI